MGAITILLVLGVCVFLIWFFEACLKDAESNDGTEYVYMHPVHERSNKTACAGRPTVYAGPAEKRRAA